MRRLMMQVALIFGLATVISAPAAASVDSPKCRWTLVAVTTFYSDEGLLIAYWETWQLVCDPPFET